MLPGVHGMTSTQVASAHAQQAIPQYAKTNHHVYMTDGPFYVICTLSAKQSFSKVARAHAMSCLLGIHVQPASHVSLRS